MWRRYPAVPVLAAAVIGIVFADLTDAPSYVFLVTGLLLFMAGVFRYGRRDPAITALLVCLSLASFSGVNFGARFTGTGPNDLAQLLDDTVVAEVFGRVTDWPELKPGRTELVIDVDSLRFADTPRGRHVRGALLLKVSDTTTALQRGDLVHFRTRIYPLPDHRGTGFDYGRYLRLKGVGGLAYLTTLHTVELIPRHDIGYSAAVDYLREVITESLDRNLSSSSAALAKGFLIGETRDIPPDLYRMFRDSGTLHLLAVSGSNVALVLLFFLWVLRPFRLGMAGRSGVLLVVVAVFAGISYGDPSVIRASVMAALVLGARLLGRRIDLNNTIATTALVILIADPAQLYDVGFQLSFVTAWGLIFVTPRVTSLFGEARKRRWFRWLVLPFIVTLTAQVFSAPIIAYYFGRLSLIGPLANLIIVPAVSIAVLGVMSLLLCDLVWPLLGAFAGSLLDLVLRGVVGLLHLMGGEHIPVFDMGLRLQTTAGLLGVVVSYILLVMLVAALYNKAWRRRLVISGAVLANAILVLSVVASTGDDSPCLECLSVPGGVAVISRQGDAPRADLLISSLRERNYQIDSSVIGPMLRERGIDRIGVLAVIESDYGAIDAFLRLSDDYRAERLVLGESMRPSVIDRLRLLGRGDFPDPEFFGREKTNPDGPGLYLSGLEIEYVGYGNDLVLTPRVDRTHFAPRRGPSMLVIGASWSPAPADLVALRTAGWSGIVCAKTEQDQPGEWPDDELRIEDWPSDFVVDLSRTGPYPVSARR